MGVDGDPFAYLFIAPLHLGVLAVDVLAREAKQLLVVVRFEAVAAGAVERPHRVLLSGLNALTVVPCAPNLIAFRRVSSNFERA